MDCYAYVCPGRGRKIALICEVDELELLEDSSNLEEPTIIVEEELIPSELPICH